MSHDRILREVTSVTIDLLLREPFFGHFLTGLIKEVNPQVPTLGVRLAGPDAVQLSINPDFWDNELREEYYRYGVIKHEILHIALRHILMTDKFSHKQIFNIAADIVVNQYVEREKLPEGAILLEQFRDFNLEPGQDVGYYYKRLLEEHRKEGGGGACETGGGSPGLGQLEELLGKGKPGKSSAQRLKDLLSGEDEWLQRHDEWHRQMANLSAAERSNLEQMVDSVIHSASQRVGERGIGNLPGELKSYLKTLEERHKPALDWRRALRLFASSSNRTYLKNTIRRPSKRYGTTPGIKIRRKQRLLVAVDTSGSVSDPEVQRFFSEIYQIWRHGAEVLVVECDTAIKRQYPYRGHAPDFVMGRGGTDFNAPLEFANREYHPDGIVYFTDGYAPLPRVESRYPMMWLITPNGLQEHAGIWDQLPGRKVKMRQA
ncbi:MAG: hypothetical protein J5I98_13460 [Phaeodactylibacter sp.]|nr:hypothetical protein [Phaeodactylibacter sp.]